MFLIPFFSLACLGEKDTGSFTGPVTEPSSDSALDDTSQDSAEDTDTEDTSEPQENISEWPFGDDTVTVHITGEEFRTYTISSTHPQRDSGPSERSFSEEEGDPILRSGHPLTDALFALAVTEAKQNAVSEIEDAAFQNSVPCNCYKTGDLWNWVWTRDIAYATELSLAWLDTERAKNSLLFKLSEEKSSGNLQLVQDTGTGGSWPVSTDRVTWTRGAMAVLKHTDDQQFRETVIEALQNTAQTDRAYIYDSRDGLYFGETSFLDWREQTYPNWTANNTVHIAMSKSLSTNLNHLFLLRSLEELTGEIHGAGELATAIDQHFWTGEYYASYKLSELNPMPVHQQDLLATSLAVLDLGTHPEALAQYPHTDFGAPVIHPQQQMTPIYHNRAIWPFVSSYALLAAKNADNGAVLEAQLESLIRGAALNLSHMENLEFQTGANWVDDGDYSGPVVNSHAQLWSVAGFIGAIVHGIFGLDKENGVWISNPTLPGNWLDYTATLTIDGEIFNLGTPLSAGQKTMLDESDWQNIYAAKIPELQVSGSGTEVTLNFSSLELTTFRIYRDGELIASDLSSIWLDTATSSACYSAVAQLTLFSLPSEPSCWWGENYQNIQSYTSFAVSGGQYSTSYGRPHYDNWGEPAHTMNTMITPNYSGQHYIQLVYGNGSGGFDTGITTAVKWIRITDQTNTEIASGAIVMPQLETWDEWGDSSFLPVSLQADQSYTVEISDGWNMSYLEHYRHYNGNGGGDSSYNYVNIAEMKLLYMREE